jgi:hypothetical protein
MSNYIYNSFKTEILKKSIDLLNDTINVALCNNYVYVNTHTQYSDIISTQCPATGNYITGGKELTGKTCTTDNTQDRAVFKVADPSVWSNSTITATHAIIYDNTTSTKWLIACIDFNGTQISTNGTFTVTWDATNGVINIA